MARSIERHDVSVGVSDLFFAWVGYHVEDASDEQAVTEAAQEFVDIFDDVGRTQEIVEDLVADYYRRR